jgi:hypothetical protein
MGVVGSLNGPAGTATFGAFGATSGLMGMGANADGTLFIAVSDVHRRVVDLVMRLNVFLLCSEENASA